MLGGVWLIYFSFGLLSVAMAPLVAVISRDLNLSYTAMGGILGAWPLIYIVAAAPCGAFIDRVGLKWSLAFAALIMAASGAMRAGAFDGVSLFVAVGLFGIGGPLISIGAPKAIAQWFQGAERGYAMGIYITGPGLGSILALSLTNGVLMPLTDGNWRLVFLIY
jgi:MFS family permease